MKTTSRTLESRIRKKLIRMQFDDQRENSKNTLYNIERQTRERLVRDYPDESPAEIEAKVKQIMLRGMAPTTATIPPSSRGIPKEVQDARKAIRKKQVKAGKRRRRGG